MNPLESKHPVLIVGGGGHAKVVAELLQRLNRHVLGYIDSAETSLSDMGIQYLGDDQVGLKLDKQAISVTIGVGFLPGSMLRHRLYKAYKKAGFHFESFIHPSSTVAADVIVADGSQVMAGSIIQTGSVIGVNVVVNTGAIIDHDCIVDEGCHIAPGACLCGAVKLARNVFVGSKATIIQEIDVAADTTIGAGAVITHNIEKASIIKPAQVVITER